jgi:hypothetical protein
MIHPIATATRRNARNAQTKYRIRERNLRRLRNANPSDTMNAKSVIDWK